MTTQKASYGNLERKSPCVSVDLHFLDMITPGDAEFQDAAGT